MEKLAPHLDVSLNAYVIGLLNKNRIATVQDFLRADSKHLLRISNIDLQELTRLKKVLSKHIGLLPINGLAHHDLLVKQSVFLPTGIQSLDEMLNGGLLTGNIVDICGLSGSGKTQLYTTIALNSARNHQLTTLVIDTKGDFSGERIHRMLIHEKVSDAAARKAIMDRTKLEECAEPHQLPQIIEELLKTIDSFKDFKVLVIDSMVALWFLYHGNNSIAQKSLVKVTNLLRKLAVEHGIVILTTNFVTKLTTLNEPSSIIDPDQTLNESMSLTPPTANDILVPALGKYWQSSCSLRLLIQRDMLTSNDTTSKRIIKILKSNQLKTDIECSVHLSDGGVK